MSKHTVSLQINKKGAWKGRGGRKGSRDTQVRGRTTGVSKPSLSSEDGEDALGW